METKILFKEYYERYWNRYQSEHNGLKYASIPIEQKELSFITEHIDITKHFWDKSSPLKSYSELYKYASAVEKEYEEYIQNRRQDIEKKLMPRNNQFSTEIRVPFENKPCIKVFFLDDTIAPQTIPVVEALQSVKNVNLGESKSKEHPGYNLTVYPKPMVSAEFCEKEIVEALTRFFANEAVGNMKAQNEAKFADIEKHILEYLNMAVATIDVCVAWFTIDELRDKLIEKAEEGVKVRVITFKDGVNHANGVDLMGLNHKEYRGERGGLMHDKFCVVDNVHTICGSYNWTRNAENKNDEDAAFHREDYKFASEYTKRFNQMWERDGNVD